MDVRYFQTFLLSGPRRTDFLKNQTLIRPFVGVFLAGEYLVLVKDIQSSRGSVVRYNHMTVTSHWQGVAGSIPAGPPQIQEVTTLIVVTFFGASLVPGFG